MQPFGLLESTAIPLGLAHVDTDQLIPARFMSRPRQAGYGGFLLHDLRFAGDPPEPTGFVLDDPAHAGARILVARRNFGCGSSREAAVYALIDFGVACVIAPSFGDIFAQNAAKNGLLPAQVDEAACETLLACAGDGLGFTVDLEAERITVGPLAVPFAIDPVRRLQLLKGWDDLDLTALHAAEIAAFRARRLAEQPWAWPAAQARR